MIQNKTAIHMKQNSGLVQSHLYLLCHQWQFALLQSCYETVPRHLHPLPCQPLPQNVKGYLLWVSTTTLTNDSHLVPHVVLEEKCSKSVDLGYDSKRQFHLQQLWQSWSWS